MADTDARHGSYTGYTAHGCRCEKCHAAMLRYNKRRLALIQRGEWQPWTDPKTVRRHVARLREADMSLDSIASLAGVSTANIYKALAPDRTRVRTNFAQKLLSVSPVAAPPPHARVNATGTRRRLQALIVLGWSATTLAERIGMDRSSIRKVMDQAQVEGSTARQVRALYDELSGQAPPREARYERAMATRTRNYALRRGWAPPAAWDDIDDPKENPKGLIREAS